MIALYASRRISGLLQKLTVRKDILPGGAEVPRISHADTLTGKIVYYAIMIFAVLRSFSVLNLNATAGPVQADFTGVLKNNSGRRLEKRRQRGIFPIRIGMGTPERKGSF